MKLTLDEKKLADKVTAWVTDIYNSNWGEKPIEVLDTGGMPPSPENAFLYDPHLNMFEGKLVLESGKTLNFLIYDNEEGKSTFKTF